ncbi:hypothetical protein [Guptibacillus algicola]|uniref:hypothetical protein n=1 Tax=Guptibacillus algicola TaxID=225844 RepID=UPI001CD6CAAD|nr:hypothetical protein [Alkalihalobacillus algicola]MCA0986945.1 hypothetical protein [Alkalihalobacillus algicola]
MTNFNVLSEHWEKNLALESLLNTVTLQGNIAEQIIKIVGYEDKDEKSPSL